MKFFDQFNLAQKIVMLLLLVVAVVTILSAPKKEVPYLDYYGGDASTIYRHELDAAALALVILAEVLAAAVVVGVIGLVRSEKAKRRAKAARGPGQERSRGEGA